MTEKTMQYWLDALSEAFDDAGIYEVWEALSRERQSEIASAIQTSYECYGMAFYSPPASDRLSAIDREWKVKYEALQKEFETYRNNAETAVRRALKQFPDTQVSIDEYGDVYRHGGRTERIQ